MTSFSFYEGTFKITIHKALYGWVVRVYNGSITIAQRTRLDSFEDAERLGIVLAQAVQTEDSLVSDLYTAKS